MTPKIQKEKLREIYNLLDGYHIDYDAGLNEMGFQELVSLLNHKFQKNMGLILKQEEIPTLRKHNRN